jgi:hypothetical protein
MDIVKFLEFTSLNLDFDTVINKCDIEDEMNSCGISITNETDWIEYAIDHLFDGEITDEEMVFLKSPKCLKATIYSKAANANVEMVKWF